ncbi:MAG: hypothetical protein L6Q84_24405 [Polyangiaceae bacterium]|nr:hypothetical protein [Polyangiaceae bacterium]
MTDLEPTEAPTADYEATSRSLRWAIAEALARGALGIAETLAQALLTVETELGIAAQA